MGLYGNIMTAPDGSIFTFDKIYYSYPSTAEDQASRDEWLINMANSDEVFVGRFIYIQETCEIFMKTLRDYIDKDTNKTWTYEYVKIASLMLIKQLSEADKDDWVAITQEDGVLNIIHRGPVPKIGYKEIGLTEVNYEPNKYYYKYGSDYILDVSNSITLDRQYYKKIDIREDLFEYQEIQLNQDTYLTDKFYIQNAYQEYEIDHSDTWDSNKKYYEKINTFEKIFIPKIAYDQKGHIMREITPISEQDDYTLVLNGGAFLNN